MKTISTTTLSKELGIDRKELFDRLADLNFIYRKDNKWNLTTEGKNAGGKIVFSDNYGEYITWPRSFRLSRWLVNIQ